MKEIKGSLTPKQIQRRYNNISDKISKLATELNDLQELCTHTNVTKRYGGSTGNYDPSSDWYWIDWKCPDCGKQWTTDQSLENRLKPGIEIK